MGSHHIDSTRKRTESVDTERYKMVVKETKTHAFPLRNGNYKATNNWYSIVLVNGNKGLFKEASHMGMETKIKMGDFGDADPEIVKITGVMGISELEWITEEEAAALEAEGDPIEA